MAVDRDPRLVDVGNAIEQHPDQGRELVRHRVADCVGNVDGGGAAVDGGLDAPAHEVVLGARAVLARPLHVVRVVPGERHAVRDRLVHLVGFHLELMFHVQRAGRDESVDAWTLAPLSGPRRSARYSARVARARPQTVAFLTRFAISRTASKSPLDAIGNPASITSTPISSRTSEMRSFSWRFIDAPGDCSPSRRVVSKMKTRSGSFVLLMGLVPSSTQVDCGAIAVSASPERRSRTNARVLGRSGAPKSKAPAEAGRKCRQSRDTAPPGGRPDLTRIADAIDAGAHRWLPCSGAALSRAIRLVEPHKTSASGHLSIRLSKGLFQNPIPGRDRLQSRRSTPRSKAVRAAGRSAMAGGRPAQRISGSVARLVNQAILGDPGHHGAQPPRRPTRLRVRQRAGAWP